MKKSLTCLSLIFTILMASGCANSGLDQGSPESVVKEFFSAYVDGDLETALSLCKDEESKKNLTRYII